MRVEFYKLLIYLQGWFLKSKKLGEELIRKKKFLIQNNILHSAGLLNLYGACADIDFATDDDLIEVINEK